MDGCLLRPVAAVDTVRARPVASSSHVGAHPGLTVGRGQFALAAFSGWRLT